MDPGPGGSSLSRSNRNFAAAAKGQKPAWEAGPDSEFGGDGHEAPDIAFSFLFTLWHNSHGDQGVNLELLSRVQNKQNRKFESAFCFLRRECFTVHNTWACVGGQIQEQNFVWILQRLSSWISTDNVFTAGCEWTIHPRFHNHRPRKHQLYQVPHKVDLESDAKYPVNANTSCSKPLRWTHGQEHFAWPTNNLVH